jgi:hypothetical protein
MNVRKLSTIFSISIIVGIITTIVSSVIVLLSTKIIGLIMKSENYVEDFNSCVDTFNCWLFIGYGTVFGIVATFATFGLLISRDNQDYERIELLA